MTGLHFIADDLGYPRDRHPEFGEIPSKPTWDAYAQEAIEQGALERLNAEARMDGYTRVDDVDEMTGC